MMPFLKEVEQESFDPEEFVEKLAWRAIEANSPKDGLINSFDPILLHEIFTQAIKDLQILQEKQKKKCEKLEVMCKEEELNDKQQILHLQERNKAAISLFHELDERINYVATKVIHLGDQLESVNIPRSRAGEAQKLMKYFEQFLKPGRLQDDLFTNPYRLDEAADTIQKLQLIAAELTDSQFVEVRQKILIKYDEIERLLIQEFAKAHKNGNLERMKEIANTMTHFKGYSQCVDTFIEESQKGAFMSGDIFNQVLPLCDSCLPVVKIIFNNPEQVMAKFVLNIYHSKLQTFIQNKLSDRRDGENYLKNLNELYCKTLKLSSELNKFDLGSDETYLNKLTKHLFQKYLDSYISVENKFLKERCSIILHKYYESRHHEKKPIQTSGFRDLKRDIQAFANKANFNIAQIEDYGGETFVSEEVAIALLQESKTSFKRCQLLSQQSELAGNVVQIFEIILQNLMVEHIDYAVELGLQAIPIPETKNQPQIYFLDVVRRSNAIVHLLEKQFTDSVVPLVVSTPKHSECLSKKKYLLESIENKLDVGLDRSVNAIVSWVKIYLQSEQKKSDYKPETDDFDTLASAPCLTVVQYVGKMIEKIQESLDSKNVEVVLVEFGTRLHRVIYDHLQQFQYNTGGSMCVICDVNEYRKCVKEIRSPLVTTLFDTLHALCNLLLVKPGNLRQVCNGEQLSGLDKSILLNFVQLRSDFKTQKLANLLKDLSW